MKNRAQTERHANRHSTKARGHSTGRHSRSERKELHLAKGCCLLPHMNPTLTRITLLVIGVLMGMFTLYAIESRSSLQLRKQKAYVDEMNRLSVPKENLADLTKQMTPGLDALAKLFSAEPSQPSNVKDGGRSQSFSSLFNSFPQLVSLVPVQKPEWQVHLDWSFMNSDAGGAVNCGWDYVPLGAADCIFAGGRACVMIKAKEAAQLVNSQGRGSARAFALARLTQCHNSHARDTLDIAGEGAVTAYIMNHQTY